MEADISIYDALKEGKYEASLITTYNAYLPFYEDVFLRHLLSNGCRYNILMMDTSWFSECIQKSSMKPRYAGTSYVLLPMKASAAFHPKIMLFVNKKNGLLFLGSHNMTLSGIGINRELTTQLQISGNKDLEGIDIFNKVLNFLTIWLEKQNNILPEQLLKSLSPLKNFAPWLSKKANYTGYKSMEFFGSYPTGDSLWNIVRAKIKKPIQRVIILGPFFDNQLEFVNQIKSYLEPKEIIIGVEPDTVELPKIAIDIKGVRFVDASEISSKRGYLHAKAIFIEGNEQTYLITGSANPSSPAWVAEPQKRNTEAIFLHYDESAVLKAEQIGITKLIECEELTRLSWDTIISRMATSLTVISEPSKPVSIAVSTDSGFILLPLSFEPKDFVNAILLDEYEGQITTIPRLEEDGSIVLPSSVGNKLSTRFIRVELKGEKSALYLVHHCDEIGRRAESSSQSKLRSALSNLHTDSPDLEILILAVEKVIFDNPFEIDTGVTRTGEFKDKSKGKEEETIDSLMGSITTQKKSKQKRRILSSGDLATIIDILIYKLGEGIEKGPSVAIIKPSEEEEVGKDEEDALDKSERQGEDILKICHGKVKNLINRLDKQFQLTAKENDNHIRPILQLIAVLALLRELCYLDNILTWIPVGESFVPYDSRQHLYNLTLKYLYGQDFLFLEKTIESFGDESFDELSRLYGLLLWLSHQCGEDCRKGPVFYEQPDAIRRRLYERAHMTLIAQYIASDDLALEEARHSIMNCTPIANRLEASQWVDTHEAIVKKINEIIDILERNTKSIDTFNPTYKPEPGALAVVLNTSPPLFSVVVRADSQYISIADVQGEYSIRKFIKEKVLCKDFPSCSLH